MATTSSRRQHAGAAGRRGRRKPRGRATAAGRRAPADGLEQLVRHFCLPQAGGGALVTQSAAARRRNVFAGRIDEAKILQVMDAMERLRPFGVSLP